MHHMNVWWIRESQGSQSRYSQFSHQRPQKNDRSYPPPWKYSYTRPQCYVYMHFKRNKHDSFKEE